MKEQEWKPAFKSLVKQGQLSSLSKMEPALVYLSVFLGLVFLGGGRLTVDSQWRKG